MPYLKSATLEELGAFRELLQKIQARQAAGAAGNGVLPAAAEGAGDETDGTAEVAGAAGQPPLGETPTRSNYAHA